MMAPLQTDWQSGDDTELDSPGPFVPGAFPVGESKTASSGQGDHPLSVVKLEDDVNDHAKLASANHSQPAPSCLPGTISPTPDSAAAPPPLSSCMSFASQASIFMPVPNNTPNVSSIGCPKTSGLVENTRNIPIDEKMTSLVAPPYEAESVSAHAGDYISPNVLASHRPLFTPIPPITHTGAYFPVPGLPVSEPSATTAQDGTGSAVDEHDEKMVASPTEYIVPVVDSQSQPQPLASKKEGKQGDGTVDMPAVVRPRRQSVRFDTPFEDDQSADGEEKSTSVSHSHGPMADATVDVQPSAIKPEQQHHTVTFAAPTKSSPLEHHLPLHHPKPAKEVPPQPSTGALDPTPGPIRDTHPLWSVNHDGVHAREAERLREEARHNNSLHGKGSRFVQRVKEKMHLTHGHGHGHGHGQGQGEANVAPTSPSLKSKGIGGAR
ncbi:hypothetical protein C8F01DRAFT_1367469 [Mycena amicta]|nr:hypothetical protein C8F01DRAFT_1367469 [Mycena amicta]